MKQKQEIHMGEQQSCYKQNKKESMAEWFNRYLCDPAATIDVDGIFYYRIIAKQEMTIGENSVLLCNVDYRIGGQTGDYFKDENGKRFCIRGIEHIRFNGGIPE